MPQETKRKILFVMQLPPPIHGVSVMNQQIRDSDLINNKLQCDYVNLATAKDIHDLQKGGFRKYLRTLMIMTRTISRMVTKRYDYVYITIFPFGFAFFKDALVVLLARLFGLKPLLHLHTYGFKKAVERSPGRKRFYQFVFKNTEVICLSSLLIEDIELIYKGKVYILPNGIPQVNFKNEYQGDHEPVQLLYLSNLIKGKGILLLVDAMELLKQKGYRFKFRVVGPEGDVDYKTLERLVHSKSLENEVELVGPKFGAEKYKEFKAADIFLLPSDYDTFGLVLLEAMQFGVPCIATRVGGIPDVLGNGSGIIIPAITAEEIAKAIEHLLLHPEERKRISKAGFDRYVSNFTTPVFEQRLVNILSGRPDRTDHRLEM